MSEVRVETSAKGLMAVPLFERIRDRAKELFDLHGAAPDRDLDNWLEAEREFVWSPPAEMKETDDAFEVRVAAPGFKPEELRVTATSTILVIEGEHESRREDKETGGDRVVFSEYTNRTLYRRFTFDKPVKSDDVTAKLKNGELRIEAPKHKDVETAATPPPQPGNKVNAAAA